MLCIKCQSEFPDGLKACPHCGQPLPKTWLVLRTVYPPESDLLKGLLESCGIPVLIRREAIATVQGLTLGPLAEIKVLVPQEKLDEAKAVLASEIIEDPE